MTRLTAGLAVPTSDGPTSQNSIWILYFGAQTKTFLRETPAFGVQAPPRSWELHWFCHWHWALYCQTANWDCLIIIETLDMPVKGRRSLAMTVVHWTMELFASATRCRSGPPTDILLATSPCRSSRAFLPLCVDSHSLPSKGLLPAINYPRLLLQQQSL